MDAKIVEKARELTSHLRAAEVSPSKIQECLVGLMLVLPGEPNRDPNVMTVEVLNEDECIRRNAYKVLAGIAKKVAAGASETTFPERIEWWASRLEKLIPLGIG